MNTSKPHYHRSKHSRCLDESLDIDSALDAWDRSKYKEKINKILLIEEPDRSHEETNDEDTDMALLLSEQRRYGK